MELWIPITVAAALFQNIRTALQKHLKGRLDTTGATYARFLYAVPFTWVYLSLVSSFESLTFSSTSILPNTNMEFLFYGMLGGIAQILATFILVWLFGQRNFAVGTSLTKTEAIQTAIFGLILLGDTLTIQATAGILVSLTGVLTLYRKTNPTSTQPRISKTNFIKSIGNLLTQDKSILPGITAGALFALASVSYRAASLSLGGEGFMIQSAYTLAWVTGFQTLAMGGYLLIKKPDILIRVLKCWRAAIWVGMTGMLGSAGWFTAMTLENAAHVRTLGQIELIFTLIIGYIFFKERLTRKEIFGVSLITAGILTLIIE
ncbi:EamA family transporter [Kiloniella antarctica]|uniref:EamA family transporter n=1 Tax=Kiloniella antarctica TaxID=1550907 RepID=A0ABW5BNV5_9PROT